MRKILLSIIILLTSVICSATTKYVATTGNNANAGTIGSPWRDVIYATNHVSAGDVIHVNAGTYLEAGQIFLPVGVTLEGDGITTVITSSWTTSFFPIIDLRSNEGTNGNQEIRFIKIDGRSYASPRGIEVGGRSNVSIHDCQISNFKEEGVIFDGRKDFDTLPPSIYATGNQFYNNFVNDCSLYSGFGRGCLSIGGQIGMLIHDNDIEQPARSGGNQIGWPIKYYSEGWLQGVKIYNNTLFKDPAGTSGWNFCVELFNFMGLEMYNNTAVGAWDFNFQGNRGAYPWACYIHNNSIISPVGTGRIEQGLIFEYDLDGAIIENNVFGNLANILTFYCRPATATKGVTFQKNLCYNIGYPPPSVGSGYAIGGFDAGTNNYTIDTFHVYNNTFVGNIATKANQGIGFGNCNTGHIKFVDCRNNIITNTIYPPFSIGGTAVKDNVNISYNNGFGTDQYGIGSNGVYLPDGAPTNYTNTNYTTLTPGFKDSITYPLSAGSAMRGIGQNVGFGTDLGYKSYSNVTYPTANAGADQNITLPTSSVTMAGSAVAGTYSIASHVWSQIAGTTVTITTPTSYTSTITGFASAGTYTFRLTVTDTQGNTDHKDMNVVVNSGGGSVKQYLISNLKFVNAH
jgi:hypothetical protein